MVEIWSACVLDVVLFSCRRRPRISDGNSRRNSCRKWIMSSLFSSHPFRMNNETHSVWTHSDSLSEWNFVKNSSLEWGSHKLELNMSFMCPTKGCSKNWALLQNLANLTITLSPNKLCIGHSSNLVRVRRLASWRMLSMSTEQEGEGDLLFPAVAQEVAVTLWSLARKKERIINKKSYNATKY